MVGDPGPTTQRSGDPPKPAVPSAVPLLCHGPRFPPGVNRPSLSPPGMLKVSKKDIHFHNTISTEEIVLCGVPREVEGRRRVLFLDESQVLFGSPSECQGARRRVCSHRKRSRAREWGPAGGVTTAGAPAERRKARNAKGPRGVCCVFSFRRFRREQDRSASPPPTSADRTAFVRAFSRAARRVPPLRVVLREG